MVHILVHIEVEGLIAQGGWVVHVSTDADAKQGNDADAKAASKKTPSH